MKTGAVSSPSSFLS